VIGQRPVHCAAQYGRVDAIRKLHALGADVNALAVSGYTALHLAAQRGHVATVQVRGWEGGAWTARVRREDAGG
jgi:ankyrin repeat protein